MHPGEVLREEFLAPLKLSAGALARKMDVPRTRIERIAEEKTGVTADTAPGRISGWSVLSQSGCSSVALHRRNGMVSEALYEHAATLRAAVL